MKTIIALLMSVFGVSQIANTQTPTSIHVFKVTDIAGKEYDFAQLKGKKVMIVNTASKCGFTKQYKDLQELYVKYKDKNFVIIGFPANNFGGQEPGSDSEIQNFCAVNFGVTFPMMSKVSVKGDDIAPIFKWLQNKSENGVDNATIRWNFNKFLIDENGKWVKNLGSKTNPSDIEISNWIEGKK